MDNSTTRIADLPENNNIQNMGGVSGGDTTGMETNYSPINIHPNPYGNQSANPTIIPIPQQTSTTRTGSSSGVVGGNQYQQLSQQMGMGAPITQNFIQPPPQTQYLSEEQIRQMQNQRLPSRDIPQDMTSYTQDEQIRPNYIPRANVSSDYVRDYEKTTDKNMREYENKKQRENKMDQLFNEYQAPIFIAILFFVFQMPIVNTMIFKKFSFLSIIKDDGNFNTSGLFMKSFIFGGLYYFTVKFTNYFSEL